MLLQICWKEKNLLANLRNKDWDIDPCPTWKSRFIYWPTMDRNKSVKMKDSFTFKTCAECEEIAIAYHFTLQNADAKITILLLLWLQTLH